MSKVTEISPPDGHPDVVEEVEHLEVDVAQRGEDPVQGRHQGPGARPGHVLEAGHGLADQGH